MDDHDGHWAVICPTLIYCSSNKDRQWDAFSVVDALHSNVRLINPKTPKPLTYEQIKYSMKQSLKNRAKSTNNSNSIIKI